MTYLILITSQRLHLLLPLTYRFGITFLTYEIGGYVQTTPREIIALTEIFNFTDD